MAREVSVVASPAVGVALLAGFVRHEGRAPMMPLHLFRSPTFSGNLLTLLLYGALGGAFFLLPFAATQARIFRDAGRRRVPAVHTDHGTDVALVRRSALARRRAAPVDRPRDHQQQIDLPCNAVMPSAIGGLSGLSQARRAGAFNEFTL